MTGARTLTREQMLHLVDRARRGVILPPELDDLHGGIVAMAARTDKAKRAVNILAEQYRLLEAEVTRLTAGQCTHALHMCQQHHTVPVDGCPYPKCVKAREQEAS